jgi:protein gp37
MGFKTNIEWTESTWNPATGCTKISTGCENCYAEKMAIRLKAMGQENYKNGFKPTIHEHVLELPYKWKKSQTIFVNSMSDLFHRDIPTDFILKTFTVMEKANWHRFQVLTKRSTRLRELSHKLHWTPNIWMGVTVENKEYISRIDDLRHSGANVKFLSLEPLLGPLSNLNLEGIDWVIVGGESGPGARPMKKSWVTDIRDQCIKTGTAFFFKQWGGTNKKKNGRMFEGHTWDQVPETEKVLV